MSNHLSSRASFFVDFARTEGEEFPLIDDSTSPNFVMIDDEKNQRKRDDMY